MNKLTYILQGCILVLILTGFVLGQQWEVNMEEARVSFEIQSIHGTVDGSFKEFQADIRFDPGKLVESEISGKIVINSIETGNGARDNSLRTEKYFYPKKYPYITFSSKKIELRGGSYVATGTLSMKGKSREFELPFTFDGNRFRASFALPFTKYGVNGGGIMHKDEAKVILDLPVRAV